MKKKRSLCAALLAGLMVTAVCLTGCGKKADDNAGGGSSDPDKVYQVGVCQLTQHDALDAATQGFVDALNTILGKWSTSTSTCRWPPATAPPAPPSSTPSSTRR